MKKIGVVKAVFLWCLVVGFEIGAAGKGTSATPKGGGGKGFWQSLFSRKEKPAVSGHQAYSLGDGSSQHHRNSLYDQASQANHVGNAYLGKVGETQGQMHKLVDTTAGAVRSVANRNARQVDYIVNQAQDVAEGASRFQKNAASKKDGLGTRFVKTMTSLPGNIANRIEARGKVKDLSRVKKVEKALGKLENISSADYGDLKDRFNAFSNDTNKATPQDIKDLKILEKEVQVALKATENMFG